MSLLIKRPDYIEYYPYLDNGRFTQIDIDKLEQEPALFQWTMPRAFFWKDSPLVHHLKVLGVFCGIPGGIFLFGNLMSSTPPSYESLKAVFMMVFLMFSMVMVLYYVSRSQYHSVAYKITESGILRDEVKIYPRWRYKNEVPESFLFILRGVALLVIPIALMVNPLLLAGAGGLALLSFYPFPKGEPEYAHYIPFYWQKNGRYNVDFINICESRRIIDIYSKDLSRGAIIFCTEENFDQVKQLVIDKLPEAKVLNEPLEIS
ncbi:hypothetical protein [Shewanella algae]|uniref:hypothetical protein n=1 Tax=Shewanella algae TaxID=38313 RepID=UPI0026597E88|nr:hypothetical protein [Shewanella algae]WKC42698.1 hypothetical protein QYM03_04350 [Shewanella algae]